MICVLRGLAGVAALAAVVLLAAAAEAQSPHSISVVGEAVSSTPPDFVLIHGSIPGRGESGALARKAHETIKTALEKEFPPGGAAVNLEFLGEKFATPGTGMEGVMVAGVGGAAAPAEVKSREISEKVQFRIRFGSEMERTQAATQVAAVIDKATKAGVEFASPPNIYTVAGRPSAGMAEFGIDDPADAATRACEAAIKAAREKATRLAAASGAVLGELVSIEELEDVATTDSYAALMMMAMGESQGRSQFQVDSNRPVEVRRRVRVTFALRTK